MLNEMNNEMNNEKPNIIRDKSFHFALKIIALSQSLKEDRNYEIANQIIRSGTSIGANVEEAQAAQSKKDFISKLSISSKEARETKYWLRLIKESKISNNKLDVLINDCDDLINILTKIVKTSAETI
jgi:four helix bundle protein